MPDESSNWAPEPQTTAVVGNSFRARFKVDFIEMLSHILKFFSIIHKFILFLFH